MATRTYRRSLREGALFGVLAGIIFAFVEVLIASAHGYAFAPFRLFASMVLGQQALDTTSLPVAIVVGSAVHLVLSAWYGLVYGWFNALFSREVQTGFGSQAWLGLLFGVALWFINFQVLGRLLYPWAQDSTQFTQMLTHSVAFGLPLGLMYAGAERRWERLTHHHAPSI